ncbi:MAG: exodeoxyribonuclease [Actinomycetota bacterium]
MRIATWNINSIRTRYERVVSWLESSDIDVLALQETKCRDDQFPLAPFEAAGYEVAHHGLSQWNGVAIVSRVGLADVTVGFPGMPGFAKDHDGDDPPLEARALGATVDGVRFWSLYVPNGRALDDPHFTYKLRWLEALRAAMVDEMSRFDRLAISGDFNIAPLDGDCGDPRMVPGHSTHVSPEERASFAEFERIGLTDVVRPRQPEGYTYWDYKNLAFPRDEGLRIDFVLGSAGFAADVTDAFIDRDQRKGDGPSDHVPVVVELGGDHDNDDRPMFW